MKTVVFRAAVGAVTLVVIAATASRAELPTVLESNGTRLALNGTGVRTKYFMKMYAAGLYLTAPSQNAKTIVAADEPMALRLEIVSGAITREKLLESLDEGFAKSTGGKVQALESQIEQFQQTLAGPINKGDVLELVYLPGRGVAVSQNAKPLGIVQGLPFKQALFGIWLSDSPADATLKRGLLTARAGATTAK